MFVFVFYGCVMSWHFYVCIFRNYLRFCSRFVLIYICFAVQQFPLTVQELYALPIMLYCNSLLHCARFSFLPSRATHISSLELSLTWEAVSCANSQGFLKLHGNHRFITVFLSWARPIETTPPHPMSLRFVLIVPTYLLVGLPSAVFPSEFPTNNLHAFLYFPILATCSAHRIFLHLIILIILSKGYKPRSSPPEVLSNLLSLYPLRSKYSP
jgi:hypothetical protein